MFGYVKTYPPEMKVKEEKVYKAIYCGLCKEIKKSVGLFLTPALSYDFVFLAIFRMAISGEKLNIKKERCFVHPLKKRNVTVDSEALHYTAKMHLILTYYKLCDDMADPDTSKLKRIIYKLYIPFLKKAIKKIKSDKAYLEFYERIGNIFSEMNEKEKNGASLDEMSKSFGELLAAVSSHNLSDDKKRIAERMGDMLGRFIYTADAADDIESDEKFASFNPILAEYKSFEKAKEHFPEIDMVAAYYIGEMKLCLDLIDCDPIYEGIMDNIFDFGLGNTLKKIMDPDNIGISQNNMNQETDKNPKKEN